MTADPAETSFFKAIRLSRGTVSVVDAQGLCYTRVWCQYECFITLVKANLDYKYDVYTAHAHTFQVGEDEYEERSAVGITDGIAEIDAKFGEEAASVLKMQREEQDGERLKRSRA